MNDLEILNARLPNGLPKSWQCFFGGRLRSASIGIVLIVVGFLAAPVLSDEPMPAVEEAPINSYDREHWSFRPLERPAIPEGCDREWARTPIDSFISAKLRGKQLVPQPAADRVTLIRRLYFDLIGLPPDPAQVESFVADPTDDAYERLVDELLGSPRYGERWAQFWLDVARFAETDGFEHDKVRKDAWRYRDWVIAALNADMAYDQFVRLQLAADELNPGDADGRIATMFCLAGPDMPDINSQEERRHQLLNDVTATVGSVVLGLQLGCAQCHDHKYDPLSLVDFYRMRAIFDPAVQLKKNESVSVLREAANAKTISYVMLRGDWNRRGPAIEPGYPRIANPWGDRIDTSSDAVGTSGRRSALATWITRRDHPLTARVIVNRIWQHHFGEGLSRTPSDFGVIGEEPSHVDLLDWLAVELVEKGWSLKQLHRLIVTSQVYRQSSRPADSANWQRAVEQDPGNFYLARFPRRRLSGEAIRDAMLTVAGILNTEQGGPGVKPPLPTELVRVLLKDQWTVSQQPADHFRRSVYVFARRNLRYPIFEAFDRPDGNASCPQRPRSTTAPQSLLLLNSELSLDVARRLAGRVLQQAPHSTAEQISWAMRWALGRPASNQESEIMTKFLSEQSALLRSENRPRALLATPLPSPADYDPTPAAALTDLCLALLNSSEFLYID
jgi:hypothetical protein